MSILQRQLSSMTYVDSSAFFAIISPSDKNHQAAVATWLELGKKREHLVISHYVMIETITLLHARLGAAAVEKYLGDIQPVIEVVWAEVGSHVAAVTAMLAHPGKGGPSLVDCMSFEVIRERRITDVFTYDRHFDGHGFRIIG